jgi:subtilase family serine protease
MAPEASILLVEANKFDFGMTGITPANSSWATAVRTAAGWPGVSVVSMSIEAPEFAGETSFDSVFTTPAGHPNVTFLAATGDSFTAPSATSPGDYNGAYPAFSPNVVAVGGTTLSLNPDNSYKGEVAWNNHNPAIPRSDDASSGGISLYEREPAYQQGVNPTGRRTIPDVSILAASNPANPGTPIGSVSDTEPGVAVYDSYNDGTYTITAPWQLGGGTSLATPIWGALIATADQLRQSVGEAPLDTSQTQQILYSLPADAFHKIVAGHNLVPYYAVGNYNFVTGLGSPGANVLVPALAGAPVLASLQREGIHQDSIIDLSFSGALHPGPVHDLDNYKLLAQGPNGLFNRRIRLRSATYNATTHTVGLVPTRLSLNHTYELVVRGTKPHGLRGANGIFLAGGNQTVIFSGFTPSSPVT